MKTKLTIFSTSTFILFILLYSTSCSFSCTLAGCNNQLAITLHTDYFEEGEYTLSINSEKSLNKSYQIILERDEKDNLILVANSSNTLLDLFHAATSQSDSESRDELQISIGASDSDPDIGSFEDLKELNIVLSKETDVIHDSMHDISIEKHKPNGPDCPPTCHSGHLDIDL